MTIEEAMSILLKTVEACRTDSRRLGVCWKSRHAYQITEDLLLQWPDASKESFKD